MSGGRKIAMMFGRASAKVVLAVFSLGCSLTLVGANAWMQNARQSPAWFTRGVMYQIQPRAFTPEGTLKAAEAKLPYLKDLEVIAKPPRAGSGKSFDGVRAERLRLLS